MNELAPHASIRFSPGLYSLGDIMQKFDVDIFVYVMQSMASLRKALEDAPHDNHVVWDDYKVGLPLLAHQLNEIGLRASQKSVLRLVAKSNDPSRKMTCDELRKALDDINLRIIDQIEDVAFFSVSEHLDYLQEGATPFGPLVHSKYTSAAFDIAQAGRCLALRCPTATAFHLMRVVEVALEAVRKCLNAPDPVKDAERNWSFILRKIKEAMEARKAADAAAWKQEAHFFEEAYASFDAIKTAWRNPTMHVEKNYSDEEARHLLAVVGGLMKKLSSRMDENGLPLA